jgi:plastocyanin
VRFAPRPTAALLAIFIACAVPALAGQRRVDVSSNFFNDSTLTANAGDQIVWVWTAGSHTVTSGTDGSSLGDGDFNSGLMGGIGKAFSWKAPIGSTGTQRYYCFPHFGGGMRGRIDFSASSVPASDFRLTEVRFSSAHDSDFVELTNLGDAAGDLGRYRISVTGATQLVLTPANIVVPVGGRVVIWLGQTGTGTATQQFFPGLSLPRDAGSAALYVPMSAPADTARTRTDLMVDFVQWGASAQLNEATAVTAAFWTGGLFADPPADGHSLEFCGTAFQRGPTFWQGSPVSTPGTANCVTPTRASSWGRIKAIYR